MIKDAQMLPPIESDEHLEAYGLYRQIRQGEQTRIQEYWTLHTLPDSAAVWRSQLLFDGVAPISACYLLRDPAGRPVQMVFYWRWPEGGDDLIEYRFAPRYMTVLHQDQQQEMILPAHFEVYGWHTITEHLLWMQYDYQRAGQQTFTLICPGIQHGVLWPATIRMQAALIRREIMPGPGGPHQAAAFALEVADMGGQTLHFDEYGVPLRWTLPEENLIVELIEYARMR